MNLKQGIIIFALCLFVGLIFFEIFKPKEQQIFTTTPGNLQSGTITFNAVPGTDYSTQDNIKKTFTLGTFISPVTLYELFFNFDIVNSIFNESTIEISLMDNNNITKLATITDFSKSPVIIKLNNINVIPENKIVLVLNGTNIKIFEPSVTFNYIQKTVTTMYPTTMEPTTMMPTTMYPTTMYHTTMEPEQTTMFPTTMEPTTMMPTTMYPTTMEPTTMYPTTMQPTMFPTTMEPTTMYPTTMYPTTMEPTTMFPTTMEPTTMYPTTMEPTMQPTTMYPTTMEPTMQPTTMEPTTMFPTTMYPTTMEPTTMYPTTMEPTMQPTTMMPTTMEPTTMMPTTMQPTTMMPTTMIPATMIPTTMQPTTMMPTTMIPTTTTITPISGPSLDSYVSNNNITYSKTPNTRANIVGYIGEDLYNNNNADFMRACELCSTLIKDDTGRPCLGVIYYNGAWVSVSSITSDQYGGYLYLGNKEAMKPVETTTQTPVGIQETPTISTTPSPYKLFEAGSGGISSDALYSSSGSGGGGLLIKNVKPFNIAQNGNIEKYSTDYNILMKEYNLSTDEYLLDNNSYKSGKAGQGFGAGGGSYNGRNFTSAIDNSIFLKLDVSRGASGCIYCIEQPNLNYFEPNKEYWGSFIYTKPLTFILMGGGGAGDFYNGQSGKPGNGGNSGELIIFTFNKPGIFNKQINLWYMVGDGGIPNNNIGGNTTMYLRYDGEFVSKTAKGGSTRENMYSATSNINLGSMNIINFDSTKTIRAEPGESFNEDIINNLNLFVK